MSDHILNNNMAVETWDGGLLDQSLLDDEGTTMPLPGIESDPHLLISKVRKHYMEYMIKLLSSNYETHQKLVNKNIYLPSAIWTCAKNIEISAVQACMVAQLYRKNIMLAVNELKRDTKKGKLNKKLYECLNKPPQNSKKTQTTNTYNTNNCQCAHSKRKRHTVSESPKHFENQLSNLASDHSNLTNNHIPTSTVASTPYNYSTPYPPLASDTIPPMQMQTEVQTITQVGSTSTMSVKRMSVESQDSDELMMQLEKLFQGEVNNDDDLFEGALYDKMDSLPDDQCKKTNYIMETNINNSKQDSVIENHSAQIKLLGEKLTSLAGMIESTDNVPQKMETPKNRKSGTSKWLCEEYFLKQKLYELLDQIRDTDRKKLEKIKEKYVQLFGYDSDDEGILSPLEETPEFIISCKERMAPWVVKLLTPYYMKGHIKGKGIFKALAKHLIRLIYQCSQYPKEYEVTSFVSDFLKNHRTITCVADFKEFRIENI